MKNERVIVPEPEMPDAEMVRKWLTICSRDGSLEVCGQCPYYMESGGYEESCGKLLADAARIIKFLMG